MVPHCISRSVRVALAQCLKYFSVFLMRLNQMTGLAKRKTPDFDNTVIQIIKNDPEEENYEITTAPEDLNTVKEFLSGKNIAISMADVTQIPQNYVKLEGKDAEKMLKLMEALEDHDDVQNVYANFDIPDEMME